LVIKNPQGTPKILGIRSFQSSILLSRFGDSESTEGALNIYSTFGRPCVISLYLRQI
jgi:hypothetical protein